MQIDTVIIIVQLIALASIALAGAVPVIRVERQAELLRRWLAREMAGNP